MLASGPGIAQRSRSSCWGGDWRDMVAETIGQKFTEVTGVEVGITGGTIDRLNQALSLVTRHRKLTSPSRPRTSAGSTRLATCSSLDLSRIPNWRRFSQRARSAIPRRWSYVYPIVYRTDMLPEGTKFETWGFMEAGIRRHDCSGFRPVEILPSLRSWRAVARPTGRSLRTSSLLSSRM